jgi:hypothetical protein
LEVPNFLTGNYTQELFMADQTAAQCRRSGSQAGNSNRELLQTTAPVYTDLASILENMVVSEGVRVIQNGVVKKENWKSPETKTKTLPALNKADYTKFYLNKNLKLDVLKEVSLGTFSQKRPTKIPMPQLKQVPTKEGLQETQPMNRLGVVGSKDGKLQVSRELSQFFFESRHSNPTVNTALTNVFCEFKPRATKFSTQKVSPETEFLMQMVTAGDNQKSAEDPRRKVLKSLPQVKITSKRDKPRANNLAL